MSLLSLLSGVVAHTASTGTVLPLQVVLFTGKTRIIFSNRYGAIVPLENPIRAYPLLSANQRRTCSAFNCTLSYRLRTHTSPHLLGIPLLRYNVIAPVEYIHISQQTADPTRAVQKYGASCTACS